MLVRRGEEVQGDVGREDFLRQRRFEECWEALLEDAKSWRQPLVSLLDLSWGIGPWAKEGKMEPLSLFPSLTLRGSGGGDRPSGITG